MARDRVNVMTRVLVVGLAWFAMFLGINAAGQSIFNVMKYGAVGNGATDDSYAFSKAWTDACRAVTRTSWLVIPGGKTYLVHPITFKGPCKSQIVVQLFGTIVAPNSISAWSGLDQSRWIMFQNVFGMVIVGPGKLDGRGKVWWDVSCRYHPSANCVKVAPTAITFESCKRVGMNKITVTNSPQAHILVFGSDNVSLEDLTIQSPGDSPNTDGIHLQSSHGVNIQNIKIASGDDCISIGDQTSNINISTINCGPGHGISIGSLGRGGSVVNVHDINVTDVHFTHTTNGARIKSWQEGKGQVSAIRFTNMNFTNVDNPIIIDQHYCDAAYSCPKTTTGVKIRDVYYSKATGTSTTAVAVNLNCSENVACTNINLDSIDLEPAGRGQKTTSACNNAFGHAARGTLIPASCLK